MDSTLEAPGGILFQCRVLPQQSSCASGALGTASKDLAGVSRSNVDDREKCPAEEGIFRMSTRSDTTIGKQRRQVQQVPHMRKAVERGPRKQPVGRALAKGAATAAFTAFTVLFHGCPLLGPQISSSQDGLTDNLGTQAVYLTREKKLQSGRQGNPTQGFFQEGQPQPPPRPGGGDVGRLGLGLGYPSSKCKPSTHTP